VGEKKMCSDVGAFLTDPAANYNAEIGDLIPHGIVLATGLSIVIYDPRYDRPLLYYGHLGDSHLLPIAFNGRSDASAHYDALLPMPITKSPTHKVPSVQKLNFYSMSFDSDQTGTAE
jgi:hypothetical protein